MIVPDQVKEAVDREVRDLSGKRPARRLRLRARGIDRDVDLPQEEIAVPVLEVPRLGEGKGKDVGGPVGLEEIAVQRPDLPVAGQDERDGSAREAEEAKGPREERSKSGRS